MSNTELKPCPFCGGDAEIKIMGSDRTGMLIGCTECNCDFETFETCIDEDIAWNKRVPQDNWIQIEDTSKLNYGDEYKIKTDNREFFGIWVCGCKYELEKDNTMSIRRGFFFVLTGAFNDVERVDRPNISRIKITDVKYYQPLP